MTQALPSLMIEPLSDRLMCFVSGPSALANPVTSIVSMCRLPFRQGRLGRSAHSFSFGDQGFEGGNVDHVAEGAEAAAWGEFHGCSIIVGDAPRVQRHGVEAIEPLRLCDCDARPSGRLVWLPCRHSKRSLRFGSGKPDGVQKTCGSDRIPPYLHVHVSVWGLPPPGFSLSGSHYQCGPSAFADRVSAGGRFWLGWTATGRHRNHTSATYG